MDNNITTGTTRIFPYTVSSGTALSYSSVTETAPSYNVSDTDVVIPVTGKSFLLTNGDSTHDSATSSHVASEDKEFNCKKPKSYVNPEVLNILWHVVYWTSQSLTWYVNWHYYKSLTQNRQDAHHWDGARGNNNCHVDEIRTHALSH
jgi:LMBR1-like membrane protein